MSTKTLFPETKRKTKIKLAAAVFLSLAVFAAPLTLTSAATRDELNARLQEIRSQISKYQASYLSAKNQARSLTNEIQLRDAQIKSTELEISAKTTQIEDTNLQITALGQQIDEDTQKIKTNQQVLGKLITQLHQLDGNSLLKMSLSSKNFSDFLDQAQYTTSVETKVAQLVHNIKEVKSNLEAQQADLRVQLQNLQDLKDQLEVTQSSLVEQKANKEKLLAQTHNSEASYQKLLATSQQQEADLQAEIRALDGSVKRPTNVIRPSKGILKVPINGVLTQGYGNTGFTKLGYTFHNGVDIAAPAGTAIYAAADGTTVSCDTSDAEYGNWCAIKSTITTKDGPRQIVALYGHMRTYKISGGQAVKTGQLIGYEGNSGNTTKKLCGGGECGGFHLHFTVFDAQGFGIAQGKYQSIYGPYRVPYGYTYNPLDFF